MKVLKFILPIILILMGLQIKADSPLTSTYFAKHYESFKIVKYAAEVGTIDKKIAKYLMNEKKPIAVKAAIANALGWDMAGKNNSKWYASFLRPKYNWAPGAFNADDLTAADLMLMGYLTALDDYFNPQHGLEYLAMAEEKMPQSLTVRMMHALVKSQVAFDSDWCQVYQIVAMVAADDSPNLDFAPEAVEIIMEYISLYKDECNK